MDIIIVLVFILLATSFLVNFINNNFRIASVGYLWTLFGMHFLLTITYFLYVFNSGSDSVGYYIRATRESQWLSLFGTGTTSIGFFAWPFATLMGFSYYATMILFSYFGFIATLLFYVVTKENVTLQPVWKHYSYIELVFLLPNLHFWSASLGKGSTILLGLGLFTYGLSRFNRRMLPLLFGGLITYMVRPHILFTMVVSIMLGVLLTSSGIKGYLKWIMFAGAAVVFYFISDDVVKFADTDSLNILSSSSLSHKAAELSKAASGVDIANANIFTKMFTFWFRPLFFDGLGVVGFIASFENLFYLVMLFILVREMLLHWSDVNGFFRICLFFFLLGSFILAQISGNLGIAMRQKAQIMPFFFILFCRAFAILKEHRNTAVSNQPVSYR